MQPPGDFFFFLKEATEQQCFIVNTLNTYRSASTEQNEINSIFGFNINNNFKFSNDIGGLFDNRIHGTFSNESHSMV